MIDSIIFSNMEIRFNIIFAILVTSLFAKNLGHQYIEILKNIFRYLKKSKKQRIIYASVDYEDLFMKDYSDSD